MEGIAISPFLQEIHSSNGRYKLKLKVSVEDMDVSRSSIFIQQWKASHPFLVEDQEREWSAPLPPSPLILSLLLIAIY
jgi:hypothetical protein